ncbi:hypothetical protein D3C81_941480 [compost metagenome]
MPLQGLTNARFNGVLLPGTLVHGFDEETDVVRTAFLDVAHGGLGFFDQVNGLEPVVGVNADAQAGGDADLLAGDRLWAAHGTQEFFGDAAGLLGVVDVAEDHHEFVGAIAKDRVGLSHVLEQLLPDPFEHFVPCRVAQSVVDALESVQPEKHHHQMLVMASGSGQRLAQAITQQCAVGQPCKGVVLQQMRHLEQFVYPCLDGLLKAQQLQRRVLCQLPFPGQGIGHLADFQGIERFFQNQQLVTELQSFGHGFPAVVGIGSAQGNLQVRVGIPQLFNGFQAVPAGRHTHVDESQGIGAAIGQCTFDQFQGFLALIGGVDLEGQTQ